MVAKRRNDRRRADLLVLPPPPMLTSSCHAAVYSFGICMWQMVCGMALYGGLDVRGLIRGVVRHALRPTFPAWVPPEYRCGVGGREGFSLMVPDK